MKTSYSNIIKAERNKIFWLTLIIFVLIVCFSFVQSDEYRINLITETLGVWVTIVVVDIIYKYYQVKQEEYRGLNFILNVDEVITPSIQSMISSLIIMTTEMGKEKDWKFDNLIFSDLQYMFKPNMNRYESHLEKSHEVYFEKLEKLLYLFREYYPQYDHELCKDIIPEIAEFIRVNDKFRLKDGVKSRVNSFLGQGKDRQKAYEFDIELLKKNTTPPNYKNSNAIDIYCKVWENLQFNIKFINKYADFIQEAKSSYKSLNIN